jgi:hypothetical protein
LGEAFGSSGASAGALYVRQDAVVVDAVTSSDAAGPPQASTEGPERSLIGRAPIEAWGAAALPGFGDSLGVLLDEVVQGALPTGFGGAFLEEALRRELGLDLDEDLLGWMGDALLFVRGTTPDELGGGAVVETTEPARSRRTINRLHGLLLARSDAVVRPLPHSLREHVQNLGGDDVTAFSVRAASLPKTLNVVQAGNRVVIAAGKEATSEALRSDRLLGETAEFQDAQRSLGDGFRVAGIVFVPSVLALVRHAGWRGSDFYRDALAPTLEQLTYAVIGSFVDDEVVRRRLVVGVR